jgi:hypothetical protein
MLDVTKSILRSLEKIPVIRVDVVFLITLFSILAYKNEYVP